MIQTSQPQELPASLSASQVEVLRLELQATRAAFHTLLDAVGQTGWRQKGRSSDWTAGEVLVHLTWALEYLPEEVNRARRGLGMFNLPKRLSDTLSYWYIRWLARRATPGSIARRYDRAMDAALALVATVPGEDWGKGADFYGEGFHSVEDLFHGPAKHLKEHTSGLWEETPTNMEHEYKN